MLHEKAKLYLCKIASLPVREVWIEITEQDEKIFIKYGHFPWGKCGLKCAWVRLPGGAWLSLPVREVWIEILDWLLKWQKIQSLPVREVWIEIKVVLVENANTMSLPVREVWIEMWSDSPGLYDGRSLPVREVWIEIFYCSQAQKSLQKSLPVREVWIEISALPVQSMRSPVTSREGSVDWNTKKGIFDDYRHRSLPVREVWIEIILQWKYLHILSSLPVKEVCIFQKMTYAVVFHETSERCKIRNISLRFIVLRYFL